VLPVVVAMSPLIGLLGKSLPGRPCATIKATLSVGTGAHITGICIHARRHAALCHLMIAETNFLAERMSPYRGPDLP
jgi:hypothetical protein